jgi:hypothetical protein
MNRVNDYVEALREVSKGASRGMAASVAQPSINEKLSEYYRQQYIEEQLEHDLYYHSGGGDGGDRGGEKVNSTPLTESYSFWQTFESAGSSITDLNVTFEPSDTVVQINWGDGSALENINTNVNYSHTFA